MSHGVNHLEAVNSEIRNYTVYFCYLDTDCSFTLGETASFSKLTEELTFTQDSVDLDASA